jgi:hypothetical protein
VFFFNSTGGATTMKAKNLSLVAGMALAANMGLVQAAELDETAGVPDILNGVVANEATLMTPTEMETVRGQRLLLKIVGRDSNNERWKITVRKFGKNGKVRIYQKGNVPQWARNTAYGYR